MESNKFSRGAAEYSQPRVKRSGTLGQRVFEIFQALKGRCANVHRPFRAIMFCALQTQGSASLHPGLQVLRRSAAMDSFGISCSISNIAGCFLLCIFCTTTLLASGDMSAQPISKISLAPSSKSIIVKYRTAAGMTDPKLTALVASISSSADAIKPVFKRPVVQGMRVQSVAQNDFGIERIVQVPLRSGLSAQDAVHALSGNAGFEYVEPNYRYHIDGGVIPNDSLVSGEWWLANIHAPEAWQITEGDSTIKIGFVDTGVEWLHPDLVDQFAVNPLEDINHNGLFDAWPSDSVGMDAHGHMVTGDIDGIDHDGNGYANDVIGYDFVDQESLNVGDWSGRDPMPQDENGHGTAIAGILAARQNNHIGVSGIAPKCKLVALRAFDATGNAEDDDIASAIIYAADNGVRILNLSFGDIVPSLMQRDAIRYATSKGVLVFASSGNGGGDGPHYPSDFDECVSVGGTTNDPAQDDLYIFTTHGEGMDVVAPAENILTTQLGNGYAEVSGTSASSPVAAGIAALLLSKDPNLTPLELRSVLESTTQDILTPGYDHSSANGRTDAFNALSYKGGAAIQLTAPHTMDEFHVGDTIHFTGSAMSTLFTGYSIDYGYGTSPDADPSINNWSNLALRDSQVLDGPLGAWDTHGLRQGYYTVRLAVQSTDDRSTEQHTIIWLAGNAAQFVSFEVDTIYVNDGRGLLVKVVSDRPATLSIVAASAESQVTKADDLLGLEHSVLLKSEDIAAGVPLTISAILTTPAGDTSSEEAIAAIPNEAISQVGFSQKPYSLPPGYALDSVLSTDSGDEVIENVFPDGLNFGPLKIFSFNPIRKTFTIVDSLSSAWIPRALGNTQGDSKPELLLQMGSNTALYKQNAQHSILGDIIYQSSLWGGTLADLDNSGKDDIIGYGGVGDSIFNVRQLFGSYTVDSVYYAYKWNGSSYGLLGRMPNTSPIDPYNNPSDSYSEPNAAHADLQGTGVQDLITLDNDADLIIFERDASSSTGFKTVYTETNDGQAEGSLVTTGDFDGDGKPDIAYAYHTVFSSDSLGEYPPGSPENYWTVKVLRNLGGLKFETIFFDRFYFAKPLTPYRSSVRMIRNVTGHGNGSPYSMDDLVLSLFPNFYLLEYDSGSHKMKPIWYYPVSISPRGALAYDFDHNGKREFGFVAGDSIRFFERDDKYATQTPSPGGLNVSPRDVDRVDMDWGAVSGATQYLILRATPRDSIYFVIDSTASTSYTDLAVNNGDSLIYSIVAYDSFYTTPYSQPCYPALAYVHPMPRLSRIDSVGQTFVRIQTSQSIRTNMLSGAALIVDDSISPSSTVVGGDSLIEISFSHPLTAGNHFVRVHSFELRDIYNSPFDTIGNLAFTVSPNVTSDQFYIVTWTFETSDSGTRIHVVFNAPPADNALDVSHYTLTPYGTLVGVYRDATNANALYIDLASSTKFVALGVPFVLCVNGITDVQSTPLDTKEGDCVGVSLTEPTLDNVMVYPNPAKQSDGQITFARLTAQADINIYTLNMRFIRHVSTTSQQGGAVWDMRDDNGKLVPSGMYLYYATGKNDAGDVVEGKAAKLVIVNDEAK
jgi:hypothetical protein